MDIPSILRLRSLSFLRGVEGLCTCRLGMVFFKLLGEFSSPDTSAFGFRSKGRPVIAGGEVIRASWVMGYGMCKTTCIENHYGSTSSATASFLEPRTRNPA